MSLNLDPLPSSLPVMQKRGSVSERYIFTAFINIYVLFFTGTMIYKCIFSPLVHSYIKNHYITALHMGVLQY